MISTRGRPLLPLMVITLKGKTTMFEITTWHTWGHAKIATDFKTAETALLWLGSHFGEIVLAEEDEDNADHWDVFCKNGKVYAIEPM